MNHHPDDLKPHSGCEDTDDGTIRLQPGDRSLAGAMLEGRDFKFAELARVDLTGADLYWASLQNAVLEGAILALRSVRRGRQRGKPARRRPDRRRLRAR
jgi:hypothetical protein